ncbi:MAG: T9SS type A sorting domain-containing protein [Balneola sp.]
MTKIVLPVTLLFVSTSLVAQETNPNYFHYLSGFEDSTGTTQLFYRLYEPNNRECTYTYDNESYTTSINPYKNHIYHLDPTDLNIDSLLLKDFVGLSAFCSEIPSNIETYRFLNNDPSKHISVNRSVYDLIGFSNLEFYDNRKVGIGLANPLGINYDDSLNQLLVTSITFQLVIKATSETSNYDIEGKTYQLPLAQDSLWTTEYGLYEYPDSLLIDFSVLGINPFNKRQYVGFQEDSLVISNDRGKTHNKIARSRYNRYDFERFHYDMPLFDADSSTFYLLAMNTWGINYSSKIFRVKKEQDWSIIELLPESINRRISIDLSNSGHLFLSDTTKVFFSEDYGDTMNEILEFEEEVTGLYKKPNSEILYVLTKTDLYKVENGPPTSIKQVPVSNEENPEIPSSVSLKQKYPNPFNPTTTIRFELDQATFAKLTVYDLLGRKVRELVNEIRPAGINTIQFDATNLASGVYLYRLEANGVVQTKRLTLIK